MLSPDSNGSGPDFGGGVLSIGSAIDGRQILEAGSDFQTLFTEGLLGEGEQAVEEFLGLAVPPSVKLKDSQVVQGKRQPTGVGRGSALGQLERLPVEALRGQVIAR